MVYEVKRLNIWSVAKVSFVLGAVFGFLAGLILWMFAGMLSQLPLYDYGVEEGTGGLGGFGAMLPFLLAIFYGVAAMLFNAMMAGIYNLLARMVGGIECTLAAPPADSAMIAPMQMPPPASPNPPPPPGSWGTSS
jgi:uncharacterized BrkB/YihY/UPF0761 family membrane protein